MLRDFHQRSELKKTHNVTLRSPISSAEWYFLHEFAATIEKVFSKNKSFFEP